MRIKPSRRFIIVKVPRSSMMGVTVKMVVHFTFIKKKIFVVSNIPEIKRFKKEIRIFDRREGITESRPFLLLPM